MHAIHANNAGTCGCVAPAWARFWRLSHGMTTYPAGLAMSTQNAGDVLLRSLRKAGPLSTRKAVVGRVLSAAARSLTQSNSQLVASQPSQASTQVAGAKSGKAACKRGVPSEPQAHPNSIQLCPLARGQLRRRGPGPGRGRLQAQARPLRQRRHYGMS